ncbi:hypothetical protein NP233_g3191 [Leucocoprinus birnbaumii]|uniref:C2H2-type domain-containing protein n=1 Tax=Leucocoprinus birnbaumii TaxID=56174 RepID=A0AAD5W0S6_9AGAR|nr:hypothetical protein NP233_g3191 [Leucocoprinus birnbaumii]
MWRVVRDSVSHSRHQLLNVSQTYSPAPESGIRSTLQPNSPIYQTATESEEELEEDESSAPNSPPHSSETASPVEDFYDHHFEDDDESDSATPTPEPISPPPQPSAGPSRIYLRVPPLDPSKKSLLGKASKSSPSNSRRRASTSTSPSAMSSRQNSQNLDSDIHTPLLQTYVVDEQGHKRYPCLRCDKQFGRSHDRKRHMEESTSCRGGLGSTTETEPQPMWVCERCGDSFSRRDSMNRHMKNPDACKAYKRLLR